MRECTIYGNDGLPPEDAWFHEFTKETDSDGQELTVAIIEYKNGVVTTVPLSWIVFDPYEPPLSVGSIDGMLNSLNFMYKTTKKQIKKAMAQ